jgi:hypothetical protein
MKMVSIAPSKLLSTVLVMVMTAYVSTAQPVISKQPLDQAIQPAQNVSFTIQASGPASLSYSWKKDGVTIPDQTSNSITITNAQAKSVGYYSCVVSDNNGDSIESDQASLTMSGVDFALWQGLIGYYRFNEDFSDSSFYNNNLDNRTEGVGLTNSRFGQPNGSLLIQNKGKASTAKVLPISGNQHHTVSFWYKSYAPSPDVARYNSMVVGVGNPRSGYVEGWCRWCLIDETPGQDASAHFWGNWADGRARFLGKGNAFLGNWHHVAYVHDGTVSGTKIYFDGVLQNTTEIATRTDRLEVQESALLVGEWVWWESATRPDRSISDLRVYNRALSASEIAHLHNTESVTELPLDSDNDGVSDSQETAAGTDPKDAADYPVYTKISLADVANTRLDALRISYGGFTYGENLMLGEFPFNIPATGMNVWHSLESGGNSAVTSITLPMNVSNIHGFATLINTYWGRTVSPHPTIQFTFSDGSSYTKSLVGGEDIRDYSILGIHTTSINGTSSVQSWASGSGNPVLDRQYFNLSAAGHGGKTLASVTLTDYGPSDVISLSAAQRAFLVGATAVSRAALADADKDGIPDAYETNTGVYVSPTDTGTDPNNPDSDGDTLPDGVETASYIYIDATDTGTDPNLPDTDGDGLSDNVETNTGIYVSATDTGTSPVLEDTSGDGITDGEAVAAQLNPLIDQRPVLNFLTQAVAAQPNRFGFYNEANVMHLGMGGLMIRKAGSVVNLDLQWQTKNSLTNSWTNHGAPLPFFLNLPGSKAFIRLQATPGAP